MVRDGDATGIDRFIVKQKEWFDIAYNEIYDGRKRSHWMWFIFPQLKDLGASSMAKFYGIEDEEEAKEYMSNDYLRCNLLKISEVLLGHKGRDIVDIMGDVDAISSGHA